MRARSVGRQRVEPPQERGGGARGVGMIAAVSWSRPRARVRLNGVGNEGGRWFRSGCRRAGGRFWRSARAAGVAKRERTIGAFAVHGRDRRDVDELELKASLVARLNPELRSLLPPRRARWPTVTLARDARARPGPGSHRRARGLLRGASSIRINPPRLHPTFASHVIARAMGDGTAPVPWRSSHPSNHAADERASRPRAPGMCLRQLFST